jgi:hypothetical protein
MNHPKYLNAILTVNALLLGGLLWTQIADRSLLSSEAQAQAKLEREPGTNRERAQPLFPNSTAFSNEMLSSQRQIVHSLEALRLMLVSGRLQVEVSNLDEIEVEVASTSR